MKHFGRAECGTYAGKICRMYIYIDDSADEKLCVFSALAVRDECWNTAFRRLREFRSQLRRTDGLYVFKEWHAWKFVSGRGKIGRKVVPKSRRRAIFREALQLLAQTEGVRLFNAVALRKQKMPCYEQLVKRIQTVMKRWDDYALLVVDEGLEKEVVRITRRLSSPKSGSRILEDPFFKGSQHSLWIQMADFCGYALLRRENPTDTAIRSGLHEAFPLLEPILVKEANPKDPYGIIRVGQ